MYHFLTIYLMSNTDHRWRSCRIRYFEFLLDLESDRSLWLVLVCNNVFIRANIELLPRESGQLRWKVFCSNFFHLIISLNTTNCTIEPSKRSFINIFFWSRKVERHSIISICELWTRTNFFVRIIEESSCLLHSTILDVIRRQLWAKLYVFCVSYIDRPESKSQSKVPAPNPKKRGILDSGLSLKH